MRFFLAMKELFIYLCFSWQSASLFVLMLYFQVNKFSVVLGQFPDGTSTEQRIKFSAQGHKAMSPVSLDQATFQYQV